MDLFAYAQIEDIDSIAKKNGIEVPRLRGYRLMSEEKTMDLKEWTKDIDIMCAEYLCTANSFWNPNSEWHEYSSWTDYLKKYYCPDKKIRWDRIHGWKRRVLKTYIHNTKQKYIKQAETFNKYVGRNDVLYIHARIGGGNWPYYRECVLGKPWFIEKVDDAYDNTYCDIYAKIDVQRGEEDG